MPGLVEAHAHLPFPFVTYMTQLDDTPPEDLLMATLHNARLTPDCGFTGCIGAGSLRIRAEITIRNEIEAGRLPGPRLLASTPTLTATGGLNDTGRLHQVVNPCAWVADGAPTRSAEPCVSAIGKAPTWSRGSEVDSPAGKIVIDTAQAFVGDRHVEIIQPAGGADGLYRDVLAHEGFSVRHHHFGHLTHSLQEWLRIQDFIARRSWRVVLAGNYFDLMHYTYFDTRAELGHYLEFMYQTELGKDMFTDVPRF